MKTVLVVDDDGDLRKMLTIALERAGYEVVSARNGQEAFNYLKTAEQLPCVMLLDATMPVMSGPDLLRTLGETNVAIDLPVIMQTAVDLGIPGIRTLRKPYSIEALLSAVRAHGK
jgi:DNA-binding response OmpR family regulator